MSTIHMVGIPGRARGREGVELARRGAARALEAAEAALDAGPLGELSFDERGAPLPRQGWHSSTTHTRGLAAAVLAQDRVGLDAEWIARPRLEPVRARISGAEFDLLGDDGSLSVLRHWTALEAVLKKEGIGVAGLDDCRLIGICSPTSLEVSHAGRTHRVEQHMTADHVLSVTSDRAHPCETLWLEVAS